ncbi:transglutaminase domain-containing protein [Candidatus Deferrimicrobium sp.]|uniref:transglutaminase-like domain-containing protein n=1 Tax=Candidatus Deferrimicrobium sp. TaxID=3060586 RepID=UPI002ED3ACF6
MKPVLEGVSRSFGKTGTVVLSILLAVAVLLLSVSRGADAKERTALVTVSVKLPSPPSAEMVRLWMPYPMSDGNQEITDIQVDGNFTRQGVYREGAFGNPILFAEWENVPGERTMTYAFRVVRKELVTRNFPGKELPYSREEFRKELAPAAFVPTDGPVKELAGRITVGMTTNREKARAIYDWIVVNMRRDPDTKGCGRGDVEELLSSLGGKCADIHSVFVALARAAGVPAREVFGIRLPKGAEGDMTKAQHCWAEWYLPGYGWIVVDPADVRKAILERKITVEEARPLREYYFGAVDESRIAFGTGRDLRLNPPQAGPPLNYLMYPYAEADGKPLNEDLFGFNLGYTIRFKEL